MNIFAKIVEVNAFEKTTYYTIKFEEYDNNEFEDFIIRHQSNPMIKKEFNNLLAWIKRIGDDIGAEESYFRHEQNAHALPPPARFARFIEDDDDKKGENLRLYCLRICESIVILFNGGIKSKSIRTAQECPNVKRYFDLANKLTQKIEELIKDSKPYTNFYLL